MNYKKKLRYKDAGVNIELSDRLIEKIKPSIEKTNNSKVISKLGSFGSLYLMPKKYINPVIVSSTDGVGTKLRLAIDLKHHNTIGIDLVAMCVNDLIVQGAKPLFFLDYYATGKLNTKIAKEVINGIIEGCLKSDCALVGGETAEMPGIYKEKDYDIAGFCVGIVEKNEIIDGSNVIDNDVLIALGSSGLHSNGYSLVRKIIEINKFNPLNIKLEGMSLADHLLIPTRIYVNSILKLIKNINVHAIIHLTGGGFYKNIRRILPNNIQVIINMSSWKWPPIFNWIQKKGNVTNYEMYSTFNCGVGMIIITASNQADECIKLMKEQGEKAWKIGKIKKINHNNNKNNQRNIIFI